MDLVKPINVTNFLSRESKQEQLQPNGRKTYLCNFPLRNKDVFVEIF